MSTFPQKWLICVAGPTASGKTQLAIKLAQHYHTEIISADSRQFYKELQIGVARPGDFELQQAKHHFIGHISIHDYYSAGDFERDARSVLQNIFSKNNIAIAVGGSGLYLKALTHGLDDMPKVDLELRSSLTRLYEQQGLQALQQKLSELNPKRYETIDKHNPQRLMRAIEMTLQSVQTTSIIKEKNYETLLLVTNLQRDALYRQINLRVDNMIAAGLIDEARKLYPYKKLNALQSVGYKELFDYFDNILSLEMAIEKIKQHTRNYAKKQVTWFKKQPDIIPINPNDLDQVTSLINEKILTC